MKLAQLILVIVMVGRTENDSAHATLSDKSIFALGRLGRGALGLVKSAEMFFQDVGNGLVFGEPERVIQCANKERLDWLSFRILFHIEDHRKPIRSLQNHLGDFEQRISSPCHSNLPRERFDPFVVWKQRNANLRQRRRRFTAFALLFARVAWSASTAKSFAPGAVAAILTTL